MARTGFGRLGVMKVTAVLLLLASSSAAVEGEHSHLREGNRVSSVAYFVSADDGDDSASGAHQNAPWKTLPHAQAMAREAIHQGKHVTVNLQGTFRLNQTLAFDSRDSGSVWKAAGPGTPAQITASVDIPLKSFQPVDDPRLPTAARGKVISAKLSDVAPGLAVGVGFAGWTYRELDRLEVFAANKTMTLARFPNSGAVVPGSVFVGYATASEGFHVAEPPKSTSQQATRSACSCPLRFGLCPTACMPNGKANAVSWAGAPGAGGMDGRPERWASMGPTPQLAVHGAWRFEWADQMINVAAINLTNRTFVFDEQKSAAVHYWPPQLGAPYYVLDLLQELDTPGEWWLDRASGELFVWPPEGLEVDDSIQLSTALAAPTDLPQETLGASTTATSEPTQHLSATSEPTLVLMDSVTDFDWSGIAIGRSRGVGMILNNCSNVNAAHVDARGFSGMAARVTGGSNVTLRWWNVSECGAGGILISGGDRPTLTSCNHQLLDSEISHTDNWVTYEVPAVSQQGVGTTVAHNHIHDVKHHAIRQAGNNHLIEMNLIENTLLECWDCGAYHTGRDLTWQGNVIRYNVNVNNDSLAKSRFPCAKGSSCQKVAWYLDDHMSGVEIYGNAVVGYQTGVFFHFGSNNNASQNMFLSCNASVWVSACFNLPKDAWCNLPFNDTSQADTMMVALHAAMAWPTWATTWLSSYPLLGNITWAPGATVNNSVNNNVAIGRGVLGYGEQPDQFLLVENLSAVLPTHGNWNASEIAAAQFVSAEPVAQLDFRLKPTSPVFQASGGAFSQIPTGQGPRIASLDGA